MVPHSPALQLPCSDALAAERDSAARLQALAANTPGVIFTLQWRPSGELRFLYAGGATQMLLGLGPEALVDSGQRYLEMIVAEDRPGFRQALEASRSEERRVGKECRSR